MRLVLREVNRDNWKQVASLTIKSDQEGFVPSNVHSIAEAQFWPSTELWAAYVGEEMVGFALIGIAAINNRWKVFRLMIDADHQGMGYGRELIIALVKHIFEK